MTHIPPEERGFAASFLKRYEEEKKVRVYYIEAVEDATGRPTFFYAVASSLLHEQMVRALADGNIPDYAVIAESGYGTPSNEIKDKIKRYYGFDHAIHDPHEAGAS